MATETFGPPILDEDDGEQELALAVQEENLPAAPLYTVALGEAAGDVTLTDVQMPRLNLGQKTGDLGEQFGLGAIILAKEAAIYLPDKTDPASLVVLRTKKEYREYTEFGSDEMGRVFDSKEAVAAAGLWIDWREGKDGKRERPPASPQLQVQCLVRRPGEDVDESLFPYTDPDGVEWAMAIWTLGGSAYTSAGKAFLTPAATVKGFSYITQKWDVTTARRTGPQGTYFVPVVRRAGKTTPEFQAWVSELG